MPPLASPDDSTKSVSEGLTSPMLPGVPCMTNGERAVRLDLLHLESISEVAGVSLTYDASFDSAIAVTSSSAYDGGSKRMKNEAAMFLYSAAHLSYPDSINTPSILKTLYALLLNGGFNRDIQALESFEIIPGLADTPACLLQPQNLDKEMLLEAWRKQREDFDRQPSVTKLKESLSNQSIKALKESFAAQSQSLALVEKEIRSTAATQI
ncbi:hypothetical protein BKA70DRAFT_1442812 [Coprinopsis sp. MPI-PUGE-AT-0042]|nr:hypothetical protein BKA70DRAFT_1442812 [Coprinopsis sp. MPI-PUGE-AT-0042]